MKTGSRGISMIEVLVSILIVSVGILALSGLLVRSSALGKASEFRGTASMLAADMADRMRANPEGAFAGAYVLTAGSLASDYPAAAGGACNAGSPCDAAGMAQQDLNEWQAALYASLPQGTGAINWPAGSETGDLWVMWRDPSVSDAGSDEQLKRRAVYDRDIEGSQCPADLPSSARASCMYFRVGR